MKVTGIAIVPPPGAVENPRVTPELLASVLARYSRSNEGIATILEKVDLASPDESIDRILRFVDYGHASIGGLTGGIAVAIDGVSMWLAYKLFEFAQMADGQESSSRYIVLDHTNPPRPDEIGIPPDLAARWMAVMTSAFSSYHAEYKRLDQLVEEEPGRMRAPENIKPAVANRMRRNYALDRARYFIPFATRTNLALVMSARMWAETIKYLDSLPQPEARRAAGVIRSEVIKFAPRLTRHSFADDSFARQARDELSESLKIGIERLSHESLADQVWVKVDAETPPFIPPLQMVADALRHRLNRYSRHGRTIRRMRVTFAWNNIALAELRDLNRHRTGHRYTPLIQAGFYSPPEIDRRAHLALLEEQISLLRDLLNRGSHAYPYAMLLGAQTPFEHSTMGDKFIYEAELRTGMGAHFRYASHLSAALREFFRLVPDAQEWVEEGTAEPE